jgi:hypothetical protein
MIYDDVIKKSIDDHFHKQEQYKHIKKGELASICDSDLRTVAMSWMWGKFNKDWTDQYKVIESLHKPCQDVYACCTIVDEINNGGLIQLFFFFNSTGQFAYMAQEGFRALGNKKLRSVIKKAIKVFEKNKKALRKYNDGTMESFMNAYKENLFNKLDDEFTDEEPEFESFLITYIRKNEYAFGD